MGTKISKAVVVGLFFVVAPFAGYIFASGDHDAAGGHKEEGAKKEMAQFRAIVHENARPVQPHKGRILETNK